MFWLGGCEKCGGDLYEDRDQYGNYIACIQCGHYPTEARTVRLRLAARLGTPSRSRLARGRELIGAGRSTR